MFKPRWLGGFRNEGFIEKSTVGASAQVRHLPSGLLDSTLGRSPKIQRESNLRRRSAKERTQPFEQAAPRVSGWTHNDVALGEALGMAIHIGVLFVIAAVYLIAAVRRRDFYIVIREVRTVNPGEFGKGKTVAGRSV